MTLLGLIIFVVLVTIATAQFSRRFRAFLKYVGRLLWDTLKRSALPAVVAVVGMFIVFLAELLAESSAAADQFLREVVQIVTGTTVPPLLKASFFEEVGIGFIISGLIAFMVEFNFHKREEQKVVRERAEIAKSVFNYLLGSLAPEWLTQTVADLYKMKLVRENIVVAYVFEGPPKEVEQLNSHRRPDIHEILKVFVEVRYRLRNLTDQRVPGEISHGFTPSVPLPGRYTGFTELVVTNSKGDRVIEWYENCPHKAVHCPVATDVEPRGWKNREIRVIEDHLSIEGKDTVDVVLKLRAIRWVNDHATWVTRLPADHIKVIVNNDKLTDIEFMLDPAHPKAFNQTPNVWEWESTGESIPFQGFTLHWFPSPKDDSRARAGHLVR